MGSDLRLPAVAGGQPVRQDFLIFGAPLIGNEEIEEVIDTLRSGWIGYGPKSQRFEANFGRYVGAPYAISLASCTAGLELALVAGGVGPGDEVILPSLTFAATANVVEHVGAVPVFVDVDATTQNIDPELVVAAITPRTKAIIPVHLYGRPCDMDALTQIAQEHGLFIVEDAAHAIEAAWNGRKIGTISRFTAFSFYATKNLTTAEGGMLTTADRESAELISILRLHGLSKDAWNRYSAVDVIPYETVAAGYKFNMTDLQASIGLHQLARLEANLVIREQHWQAYDRAFGDLDTASIPSPAGPKERHARHLYTLILRLDKLSIGRHQFLAAAKAENIGMGIHFTPVHKHAYYANKYKGSLPQLPNTDAIGRATVSLPLSAKLTDQDVADVICAVTRVLRYYHI
jgi:dTDP-4-amino-4,6-dideoxygalactose transaminase